MAEIGGFELQVLWDGGESFVGLTDDDRIDLNEATAMGITAEWGMQFSNTARGVVMGGRLTMEIDDREGKYDPHNPGSPLAGKIIAGRRVRLVYFLSADPMRRTPKVLWEGRLEDPEDMGGDALTPVTNLVAVGVYSRLSQPVRVVRQVNRSVTDAAADILREVGLSLDTPALDTVIPLWEVDDEFASLALRRLENTYGGVFVESFGTSAFGNRLSYVSGETLDAAQDTPDMLMSLDGTPLPARGVYAERSRGHAAGRTVINELVAVRRGATKSELKTVATVRAVLPKSTPWRIVRFTTTREWERALSPNLARSEYTVTPSVSLGAYRNLFFNRDRPVSQGSQPYLYDTTPMGGAVALFNPTAYPDFTGTREDITYEVSIQGRELDVTEDEIVAGNFASVLKYGKRRSPSIHALPSMTEGRLQALVDAYADPLDVRTAVYDHLFDDEYLGLGFDDRIRVLKWGRYLYDMSVVGLQHQIRAPGTVRTRYTLRRAPTPDGIEGLPVLGLAAADAGVITVSGSDAAGTAIASGVTPPTGATDTLYMLGILNDALYTLDRTTGVATRVGNATRFGVGEREAQGLAWDGENLYMVGSDNDALFTLDIATGVATRVGNAFGFGVNESAPRSLAWVDDTLYMMGNTLYTLDRTTGVATRVNVPSGFGVGETHPTGMAWDGQNLYMLGGRRDWLYRLDRTTGVATRVGNADRFGVREIDPQSLAWDGQNLYMLGALNDALFTLDRTTGVATRVGSATAFGIGEVLPTGLTFIPNPMS